MSDGELWHDDSLMPFGQCKGLRLGDIPDHYWLWFLDQPWRVAWPELVAYAKCCGVDD